jgi:DNA topoisomerase-1
VTLRDGRFGPFVQLGDAEEGEKPKRSSLPRGMSPSAVDLERALKLLALPRQVATHPESGEPILVGIGRYGPYVQHGRIYATIGSDDDVLEIGGNRAIDLIVAKETGGGFRRGSSDPGRPLGTDPESGAGIVVKSGRYGPYVTDGKTNATIPKSADPETIGLDEALTLLAARREAAPARKGGRSRKAATGSASKASSARTPTNKKAAASGQRSAATKTAAKKATAKAPVKKAAKKASAKTPAARRKP